MSTVVFYFTTDGEMGSPFDDPQYFGSYQRLFKKIQASGMAVHIARGTSYKGAMQFSPTWEVTHSGDLVLSEQGCKADVIYLKGYGILDQLQHGDAVMNPLRVTTMAHDKWQTYETLQQHMATSILIPKDVSESQWDSILQKIPTDLVVLKPRFGHGGNGVVVLPKANLSRDVLSPDVEYFAQAFIDASNGIPGITQGNHDLRVFVSATDLPLLSFVRVPKPGGYISNLYQGGTLSIVDITLLPQAVLDIVSDVQRTIQAIGPSFCARDFMLQGDKAHICEINSQPGMGITEIHGSDFENAYHQNLVTMLLRSADTYANLRP